MASPARVIVRLPNWLGDTVMAVPALRTLRAGWPGATMLLAGPWASLLAGQGLGDTLVSYPRAWRGRLATADTVRAFRGELAILLPNSLEAALTAWYWGARRRVGFAVGGRTPLLTDRVRRPPARAHQVDEYLLLVEHLGLAAETRVPSLIPPSADGEARRRVREMLDDACGRVHGPRVGLHLGADYGPAKLWPVRRVIDACRALDDAGLVPVLLGTAREAAVAGTIVAATRAASLVGRDEPPLLPALLVELDALVAGDTGVSHLAAALGTPVVALFGPTDPALTAPRGPAEVMTHPVPCAPCFYRVCPIEHPCLDGIRAADVARAIEKAIAAATADGQRGVGAGGERSVGGGGERGVGGGGQRAVGGQRGVGGGHGVGGNANGGLGGRPEPPNFK